MRLFFVPEIPVSHSRVILEAEDARHCVKVLRLQAEDTVHLTDGKGNLAEAILEKADSRQCQTIILKRSFHPKNYKHRIHLAVAPTKSIDRTEWFVEKAIELGVDSIRFFTSHYSERKTLKEDRIQRIAVAAIKQSLQFHLPQIHPLCSLTEVIDQTEADQKFIAYTPTPTTAHLLNLVQKGKSSLILIGPEGGFSKEEVDMVQRKEFVPVSLGANRLRTETAGVAACHILNLVNLG